MKKNSLFLSLVFLLTGYVSQGQIVVDNATQTPEELVQNVLVGTGVTVSNVQFNASTPLAQAIQTQVGFYDANGTTFPILTGLVLATGDAQVCVGPNNSGSSTNNNGVAPDPNDVDLAQIGSPYTMNNEAILEFDFVPTGDSIVFNYIFASEEYHEYSTSSFNDGFGFIISGPGFAGTFQNGGENIAIVPGTGNLPVTMNNLNNGSSNTGPCTNCAYLTDNPTGSPDLQFDAHTVVLQAAASVQCGETYHIKLVIGDAGDTAFDSAVFLESNSFSSNSPDIAIELVDINGDPLVGNELIEGCTSAAINFIKPDGYTDSSYTVSINVNGTATNGTDYTTISPNYTIPPGQDTLTVTIDALADALPESTETLIIETYYLTPCGDTMTVSASINIIDNPPSYNVFADDIIIDCPQSTVDVTAYTDGGIPNLSFDWGIYGSNATAALPGNINGTQTYTVTVTDECGMVQDTTVNVTLNAAPVPTIDFNFNTFTICPGDVADIDATINNPYDPGSVVIDWQPTGEITEDISVSPNVETWYYMNVSDGCYNIVDSVKVEMGTVTLTDIGIVNAVSCPGLGGFVPGEVHILPDDPTMTYTLTGTAVIGPQNDGDFLGVQPGSYFLNVTNSDGCMVDTAITVGTDGNVPSPTFVMDSLRDVTCFGMNDGGAYVTDIESLPVPTGPYDVVWTHTSGIHFSETVSGVAGGNPDSEVDDLYGGQWIVSVTDADGCPWSEIFTVFEPDELQVDWNYNDPTCYQFSDGSVTVNATGGNGGNVYQIWDASQTILNPGNTNTANTLGQGWYYADITDANGCYVLDSIELIHPGELDIDLVIDQPLCYGQPTGLATVDTVYNATGAYNQIAYFWTPNPSGNPNGIGTTWINHLGEGSYTLTINDQNGCDKTFDFSIAYPPELEFTEIGSEEAYCRQYGYQSGNGVVFAAAGGGTPDYTYTWTNLQTNQTSNNTTWGGLNPGDYYILVQDNYGCILTDTVTLDSLNPVASYDIDSDQFLSPGIYEGTAEVCIEFTNTSENYANPNNPNADTTFFWNLNYDAADPGLGWQISHDYAETFDTCFTQAGEFEVCLVAINKNGCTDTSCNTMIIYDPLQFTPVNIFTPNNDGDNDVFTFANWAQAVATFECTIVNRWGVVVHIMTDINDEWDGTDFNGDPLPDGIYYYTYSGVSTDNTAFSGQGFTHIVGSGL
ncbi:MAG: choice-of-anchor L domain-containing protein [Crocinitomicaceae bacterium]